MATRDVWSAAMAIGELSLTRRSLPALMLGLGLGLRGAIRAATPEATPDDAPDPMWRELAPIPLARSELGVAVIGTDIYIVGGFGGGDRVDRFDTVTGTWHHVADLPVAVHHPGATALDGRIYVAGGYLIEDSTAIADVWSYDPEADAWERRTSLSTPRGAFGLVAHNGALFAVGGAFEQLGGPATGLVERYDPGADLWVERTSLPTPREHLAVIASEDRIFAIGGRAHGDESDALAGANEGYDPATNPGGNPPPPPGPSPPGRIASPGSAPAPTVTSPTPSRARTRSTTRRPTGGRPCRRSRCRAAAFPASLPTGRRSFSEASAATNSSPTSTPSIRTPASGAACRRCRRPGTAWLRPSWGGHSMRSREARWRAGWTTRRSSRR